MGNRVSCILIRMVGVWALGGGRCVGCNFALLFEDRALDPLAFGDSPLISSTKQDKLVRIVDSIVIIRDWTHLNTDGFVRISSLGV